MSHDTPSLRVLMLLHNLEMGGAQNAVFNLVRALNTPACRPVVCGWRRGGALAAHLQAAGIATELPDGTLTGWRRLRWLRETVDRNRIDLIHAHMSDSAFWGVLLQQLTGGACVVTHHSNDLVDAVVRGPLYRWARHRLLFACSRRAAVNITVSGPIRDQLIARAGVAPERVYVIPNSICPPPDAVVAAARAPRRARAAAGFGEASRPRILYVGRLIAQKGVDTLIAAMPRVLEVFPSAAFVLLGDGADAAALRAQVCGLGLSKHVRFAGKVGDVPTWLAEADLLASASHLEGLPVALLEAMSWGLPVVVSDIPGHRELIARDVRGRLVPVGDPEALAQGCVAALQEWQDTAGRADQALAWVRETQRADVVAQQHLEIYRKALNGGAGTPRLRTR